MSENSLLSGNIDSNNSKLLKKESNNFSNLTLDEMIYSPINRENTIKE